MASIFKTIDHIRYFDDLARQDSFIHRLHPLTKLLSTTVYALVLVSHDKYATLALLPFLFFPVLVAAAGRVPLSAILKRLLYLEPMIICLGLLNPLFDRETTVIMGHTVSSGWLIFASIVIKGSLAVSSALLLMATTGMEGIALSLRMLRVPRIMVLQLLLTYRYLSTLLEEGARIMQAYSFRSLSTVGVAAKAWGSLLGQVLLRTIDRAQRIYDAMCLRGFNGEYVPGKGRRAGIADPIYLLAWGAFFVLSRVFNLPLYLGCLLTGGVR